MIFSKLDIRMIVTDHFATLVDYRTNRPSMEDRVAFFIVPIAVAVALAWADILIGKQGVDVLFTGISIFAGLLFNLLVLTHGIVRGTVDHPKHELEVRLLREVYANISYAILVSIAILGVLLIGYSFTDHRAQSVFSGVTYFLLGNFLLTLLLVLKRIHVILRDEFARKEKPAPKATI